MIKTFYLFGIMVLLSLSSQAQNASSQRLDTPEKKATFLVRDLQNKIMLNDQQKDSLFTIFQLQFKLADSLKKSQTGGIGKRQYFQSMLASSKSRIDSVLTRDQRVLFYQWKSNRKSLKSKL